MMIIQMEFNARVFQAFSKISDPAGLSGIYDYEPGHLVHGNISGPLKIINKGGLDKKIPSVLFLRSGKGKHCIRIDFFCRNH